MRSSLDFDSAISLANSLVQSKRDYCNSLLYSVPISAINRLQRVQNSLARIACQLPNYHTDSSALLKRLHWLPGVQCIQYKIAVLIFRAIHRGQPSYLSNLFQPYQPSEILHSSSADLLSVPDIPHTTHDIPYLWFCTCLSTFCSKLKTYLFSPES